MQHVYTRFMLYREREREAHRCELDPGMNPREGQRRGSWEKVNRTVGKAGITH